jgi:hypothetical protein
VWRSSRHIFGAKCQSLHAHSSLSLSICFTPSLNCHYSNSSARHMLPACGLLQQPQLFANSPLPPSPVPVCFVNLGIVHVALNGTSIAYSSVAVHAATVHVLQRDATYISRWSSQSYVFSTTSDSLRCFLSCYTLPCLLATAPGSVACAQIRVHLLSQRCDGMCGTPYTASCFQNAKLWHTYMRRSSCRVRHRL